jgi:outer membrane protein OmpA-like peptidoglycan-associated protein
MLNHSTLTTITFGLFITLSSITIATPDCERATELNYQAYESTRQGFPNSRAKHLLEQALRLCPAHAESHNNLGELFRQEANYTQAIRHYRQALRLNSRLSAAWHGLGETYYQQRQFPLSLEAHLHACQTDRDSQQRVIELLKEHRYAVTEAGEIVNKESLLVLYDPQRRAKIKDLIADCGLKAVVGSLSSKHVFRNFHFDTGKATLQAGSAPQLAEIAAALRQLKPYVIKIHGHTDIQRFAGKNKTESDWLNQQLSEDRAAAVADALSQRGVLSTRIVTKGYGYSQPAPGFSKRDLAKNRRVEIEVD